MDAVGRSGRVAGAHVRTRPHAGAPACRDVAAGLSVRRGRGAASRGGGGAVDAFAVIRPVPVGGGPCGAAVNRSMAPNA